ncbi:MAG TPA: ABC transporter ATP-binding protein [Acetobacteraceae bacterium]|jgi:peptide/nickel transport system ATP-binding protein|nr:ABC transporter ATP-binding protein [Acetobacteraceae bacterium]
MNNAISRDPPLLEVRNLTVRYGGETHGSTAVHDVSFRLQPGEALGIVGESGSGKSSIAGAILDFLGPVARITGQIRFEERDLTQLGPVERRAVLGRRIGAVFQDPFTALNPAMRVGRQIAEPMVQHLGMQQPEAMRRAESLLREMGIHRAEDVARAFPHQLSGGMKQRALIAAALACEPPLLILDEPTTALDVTVEAQILRLLARLRRQKQVSLLFISHNLGVVRRISDSVAVMYASQFVERGEVREVLERPTHPYSKGLLASRPPLQPGARGSRLPAIQGQMPSVAHPEMGCVFAPRCPFVEERCTAGPQAMVMAATGHAARCWKADTLGEWPRLAQEAVAQPPFRRGDALVNVTRVRKTYATRRGFSAWGLSFAGGLPRLSYQPTQVMAVDGVSLSISPGEVLGLVGESGCGKSTLGRLALQLLRQTGGNVEFDGADLGQLPGPELRAFRKQAQIVFQNVGSSLNPRLSVGQALERPLALFGLVRPRARRQRVEELLEMVRLPSAYRQRYPHQLSGGERQRVAIARALATEPRFIVCDEPVSALDVSVQATIVNLLADLRDQFDLAYLFISHDLAVVAQLSDRVAVMYHGRICETGTPGDLLAAPRHPYTRMLLAAVADDADAEMDRPIGGGQAPPTAGCVFAARCPNCLPIVCATTAPSLRPVSEAHEVACHLDIRNAPGPVVALRQSAGF